MLCMFERLADVTDVALLPAREIFRVLKGSEASFAGIGSGTPLEGSRKDLSLQHSPACSLKVYSSWQDVVSQHLARSEIQLGSEAESQAIEVEMKEQVGNR